MPTTPIHSPPAGFAQPIPKEPPAPGATTTLPPTGSGTSSTGPASIPPPPPPPRRPRRRFRTFLLSLFILTTLGYGGGVYYSLVSDNFHDFFTEYVPYGEDAVGYFEDREYRKRFPSHAYNAQNWPQKRGEQKVTIGRSSGLTPRVAVVDSGEADLGSKGRHMSAVEDNKNPPKVDSKKAETESKDKPPPEKKEKPAADTKQTNQTTQPKETKPKSQAAPKQESKLTAAAPKETTPEAKPAPVVAQIDHVNVPEASEAVVQDAVKLLNNIITAVNASPEASKFTSTLTTAKEQLNSVIRGITSLKDRSKEDTETQMKNAHMEFDEAAKELVRRLENEMKEQDMKWKDEYEGEREKLSSTYQQKLSTELDAAHKVADEKRENALLEQEITLQKKFLDDVRSHIEAERSGRLSKLNELSSSVSELEKLTSEWNSVVDATLSTQHLQVALEAVRAKLDSSDLPSPFLNELVALKEVSKDNATVTAAIASINPTAYQRGIPSGAALIDRFRRVGTEVRKASLLPEDAGVASHAASAVLSRFMFTKKSDRGLPEGDDVEATLARTEVLLEEGDLDAAAREMNGLKGWAGVLSRDWVGECRRVLEVRQAIDVSLTSFHTLPFVGTKLFVADMADIFVQVIATEARLQSLLVD